MNRAPFHAHGIYAITPDCRGDFDPVLRRTAVLLAAGIALLQYRDKVAVPAERQRRAMLLRDLCHRHDTPFIINDHPELAAAVGADGVHVGEDDVSPERARRILGAGAIVGVSCYADVTRAVRMAAAGADYVALGAFHPTTSKTPRAHATTDTLRAVREQVRCPVVAIGGITPENSAALVAAGADLLAVIGALYAADDPVRAVAQLNGLFPRPTECES
jgi:thiamine-phosphate pyrophosphorylase